MAQRLFGAYWDDELTQAEREWLESHFASCPSCRGRYDELARTLELMGELPRAEVTPGFAERALTQAHRRVPAADRIPAATPPWIPITATAVLLAVLGGMVVQWSGVPLTPRRRPEPVAIEEPVLVEPARVAPETKGGSPVAVGGDAEDPTRVAGAMPEIRDSLFDHSEDVEFILDGVTLRKGRAHTVVRVPTEPARGQPAVITF